jgi:hypothetical protein
LRIRNYITPLLVALVPATAGAAGSTLRGSPASMSRQHDIAVEEELTFAKTPGAVLAEVSAGTLTPLDGNDDYEIANVSFNYAVPEVRMLVERLAEQYRAACGEKLVVTSLTRPKVKQPRNAHVLSVHPAGMAVDFRISDRASCRTWLESTLLQLEGEQVLDATRERMPPHYHVAVFPTPYREYVAHLDAMKAELEAEAAAVEPAKPVVQQAAIIAPPVEKGGVTPGTVLNGLWLLSVMLAAVAAVRIGRS